LLAFPQGEFLNNANTIAPSGSNINTPNTFAPSVFSTKTKTTTSSGSIMEPNTMEFTNNNNFKNPGDVYKKKLNEKTGEDESKMFRKNQYLGDFKSQSAFVKIGCRDFGQVDGDQIRILVNDKVVQERIFLDGDFKGIELGLEKGFNKIDFEALNQGELGPNTAEFRIFDDKGMLISANQWNLATGFKATIIIVK
jgi:hypothetical protein